LNAAINLVGIVRWHSQLDLRLAVIGGLAAKAGNPGHSSYAVILRPSLGAGSKFRLPE
jgi:hypothetical protein